MVAGGRGRGAWGVSLAAAIVGLACATGSNTDGGSPSSGSGTPTSGEGSTDASTSSSSGGDASTSTSTGGDTSTGTASASSSTTAESSSSSGAEASTSSTSTTGPFKGCGDGLIDGDEACDDGNMIDADGCNDDCTVSGELLWSDSLGSGLGQPDEAFAAATDGFGNLYVAGYVSVDGPSSDIWYRKYDDAGAELWTTTVDGPASGKDQGRAIAAEDSELFYVGGYTPVAMESNNTWLRRHGADGSTIWTEAYNGVSASSDIIRAIALDGIGGLVAVGHTTVTGEGQNVWMRRYSEGGVATWTRTFGGAGLGNDSGIAVAVAGDGSIYVGGAETVPGEGYNMWLAHLDQDGNTLWTRVRNGPANKADYINGVVALPGGDAIVCGYEGMADIPWQAWIRRYDNAGGIVWTTTYDGETHEGAYCDAIARDSAGDLVFTGGENVDGVRRIMVRKLADDGSTRWGTTVPPAAAGPDFGRGVAIGPDDSIYVVGAADMGTDARDLWVGRFRR